MAVEERERSSTAASSRPACSEASGPPHRGFTFRRSGRFRRHPSRRNREPAFKKPDQRGSVRRRIDIEPDDIAQLIDEFWILGQFELPNAMLLKPVGRARYAARDYR
jgi:hypothetical protein